MLAIPRLVEVSPCLCFTFLWGSPAHLRAHVCGSQGAPSTPVSSVQGCVCEASWSLSPAQSPQCPLTQPAVRCPSGLGVCSSHAPLHSLTYSHMCALSARGCPQQLQLHQRRFTLGSGHPGPETKTPHYCTLCFRR